MDKFEKKYWIKEDEKVKDFHRSRKMFCIYNNKLYIAKPNLPYSHAFWFESEWWMNDKNDDLMNNITRWIIDSEGDIYFYVGYDFRINETIEKEFFKYLNELVTNLNINKNSNIYWWLIKAESGKIWPPAKEYWTVSKYI